MEQIHRACRRRRKAVSTVASIETLSLYCVFQSAIQVACQFMPVEAANRSLKLGGRPMEFHRAPLVSTSASL